MSKKPHTGGSTAGAHLPALREQGARIAREMSARLLTLAANIETDDDPRILIADVIRARNALRGYKYKPEVLRRLWLMEALHRGQLAAEMAERSFRREAPAKRRRLAYNEFAVTVAIDRFHVAYPDAEFRDRAAWSTLMAEWRRGRGAPSDEEKGERKRRRLNASSGKLESFEKWDRIAKLLNRHMPGRSASGRTLASAWDRWKRTARYGDHFARKPGAPVAVSVNDLGAVVRAEAKGHPFPRRRQRTKSTQ